MIGYDYNQHTLADVRSRLAYRLNDPSNVFWSSTELNFYLQESLDCFGVYGRFFLGKSLLDIPANSFETTLDLCQIDDGAGLISPISYSVSGQKVLKSCLAHLLETNGFDLTTYTATSHIATTLLNQYISLAFNQFLQDSACFVSKATFPSTSLLLSGQGYYSLPTDINNIIRMEWTSLDGVTSTIYRSDSELANMLDRQAVLYGATPQYYSIATNNIRRVYFQPLPSDNGIITIYYIHQQALTADLFTTDESFSMPYEFWWAVKYLVLHKIYSTDGPTKYPQMSSYCLSRYEEAVRIARAYSALEQGWGEESPIYFSTLSDFDTMMSGWRNKAALDGTLYPGQTIIANVANYIFVPRKTDRITSFTFDIARNVPTLSNTDYFPVAEDYLPYILDYAEHLALHKCGGMEFAASTALLQNFYYGCGRVNDKITALIHIDQARPISLYTDQRRRFETDTEETQPISQRSAQQG